MKAPAFQFYPGDYLRSQRVQLLTLEEEGAYIRLLASCWLHGSIPSDADMIARLIGKGASTTLATTLSAMFVPDPNDSTKLVHERLEKEREKQEKWREKSSEGGRKSALSRQPKRKNTSQRTTLEPPLTPNSNQAPNQDSTLLSAVSSLQTAVISKPAPAVADASAPKVRARDEVLDALVTLNGESVNEVTRPAWSQAASAKKEIVAVTPDVTPEEVRRRAANYRLHMPNVTLSSTALSKHWAKSAKAPEPREDRNQRRMSFA